jgi:hypothetical protein
MAGRVLGRGKSKPPLRLEPGDQVLVGSAVLAPLDWFVVRVLLVCDDEIATEHAPASGGGQLHRQFLSLDEVRAVAGPDYEGYAALQRFRETAQVLVSAEARAIEEAGQALQRARRDLRSRLEELGTAEPQRVTL